MSVPSACWIIDASKPAPAMTAKRSPLNRPTSSFRRSPSEADRDRLLDVLRDAEVRREQVRGAGRQDRERSVRACERVDRSAAPSRRRPRRRAARAPRRARASPASARSGSSAPRSTAGRRLPGAPARRRSSGRPPPNVLPACAMTATFVISRRAPGGPRDENERAQRGDADRRRRPRRRADGACRGTCERSATNTGIRRSDDPDRDLRRRGS